MRGMSRFSNGERIHLVDQKRRQYAFTLKAGETYQFSGQRIAHDTLIGRPDGSIVTLSGGKKMVALRPTFGDYVLKMPRGPRFCIPRISRSYPCGLISTRGLESSKPGPAQEP